MTTVTTKARNETDLQFRSRLARARAIERDRSEPLVTHEAQRHGNYTDCFVSHVETGTTTKAARNRQTSSLAMLRDRGRITDEQYSYALQIARVAEYIQSGADSRPASYEARVDCSGSSRDPLIERLGQVRAERAYTDWRNSLPMPRRMIIDMVIADRSLKATARTYSTGWPRAFKLLTDALDAWPDFYRRAMKDIDESELDNFHRRLTHAR